MVVDTLAAIGDPSAVDSLVSRLDDEDPNVRAAATDALASVGTAVGARALLATATRTDEDQLVRFSALRALSALEVPVRANDLASDATRRRARHGDRSTHSGFIQCGIHQDEWTVNPA
jgi:HEAT repeat protein